MTDEEINDDSSFSAGSNLRKRRGGGQNGDDGGGAQGLAGLLVHGIDRLQQALLEHSPVVRGGSSTYHAVVSKQQLAATLACCEDVAHTLDTVTYSSLCFAQEMFNKVVNECVFSSAIIF